MRFDQRQSGNSLITIILLELGAFCISQMSKCFLCSSYVSLRDLIYKGRLLIYFSLLLYVSCIFVSLFMLKLTVLWKIMASNMQKIFVLSFGCSVTSGSWKISGLVSEFFEKTHTFPFTARF